MRFVDERRIKPDGKVDVTLPLGPFQSGLAEMGFTRGYLSSQAYHDQFKNRAFQPKKKSIDFDTKPFAAQYEWRIEQSDKGRSTRSQNALREVVERLL